MEPLHRWVLHHGQTRPGVVDVELDVAVLVGAGAGAVVSREEPADQAILDHLGRQRVGQVDVRDRLGLAEHRADLASIVTAEVGPHTLTKVGRLSHVQDLVGLAAEHVHAG